MTMIENSEALQKLMFAFLLRVFANFKLVM